LSPSLDPIMIFSEKRVQRPVLVSVIMAMRNSAGTIASAVRSIQLQTLQDWELIIIDDGSADESVSIVRAFNDSRIRVVSERSSAGLATRLNQAVALSRGVFIARMDADDICFPARLARQTARLQQDPQLDLVGCGTVVFTADARLVGEMRVGLTHEDITARPSRGFPLPHPSWCGRAEWFHRNPYDVRMMKTQDQDLLLRTFKSSRFAAVDDVLIGYRQDALDLTKLLLGRRLFMGALWRQARRSGDFFPALGGIGIHLIKSSVDVATVGLGLNRFSQLARLNPVRPEAAREWQDLAINLELSVDAR
jgi:glycosyltransferase involved in cell wall biosynthesis